MDDLISRAEAVDKDMNVPCTDTISRQAAIEALRVAYWDDKIQSAKDDPCIVDAMIDWAIRQVKALPSAQPDLSSYSDKLWRNAYERGKAEAQAEIIRCRDCKHWREGTAYSYCDKLHGMGVLDIYDYMTSEDDFCSMAERR